MRLFGKKATDNEMLKIFDGRTVKYITKRVEKNGEINHDIVGKGGRIVFLDGEIRILLDTKDVFRGEIKSTVCNMLLSGDGATVKGKNLITGEEELYTVYFSYYRK
ncbi:MAG: hypothetical protein KBS52_07085 [Clostridiales bacterium]|nr:hypothetical protein [Candidatus Equinaster intestinalis]